MNLRRFVEDFTDAGLTRRNRSQGSAVERDELDGFRAVEDAGRSLRLHAGGVKLEQPILITDHGSEVLSELPLDAADFRRSGARSAGPESPSTWLKRVGAPSSFDHERPDAVCRAATRVPGHICPPGHIDRNRHGTVTDPPYRFVAEVRTQLYLSLECPRFPRRVSGAGAQLRGQRADTDPFHAFRDRVTIVARMHDEGACRLHRQVRMKSLRNARLSRSLCAR